MTRRTVCLFLGGLAFAPAAQGALPVVDDCQEAHYVDRTAAGANRTMDWSYAFPFTPQRCIRIVAGQAVQWTSNFADHPLDPHEGTTPNPIATPTYAGTPGEGETATVVFTNPGVYGFRCNYHFEMRGAVHVVAAPQAAPSASRWWWMSFAVALALLGGWLTTRDASAPSRVH